MSKLDKIKRELLEEINYRCGYCMRNITPRVYFLNDDPNKTPIHDYGYYNIFDQCHITPNSIVKDDFKDFYNLIALCKICHHEVDKCKMLDIKALKRQKLHLMIASGRFTRLEMDLLFDISESFLKLLQATEEQDINFI